MSHANHFTEEEDDDDSQSHLTQHSTYTQGLLPASGTNSQSPHANQATVQRSPRRPPPLPRPPQMPHPSARSPASLQNQIRSPSLPLSLQPSQSHVQVQPPPRPSPPPLPFSHYSISRLNKNQNTHSSIESEFEKARNEVKQQFDSFNEYSASDDTEEYDFESDDDKKFPRGDNDQKSIEEFFSASNDDTQQRFLNDDYDSQEDEEEVELNNTEDDEYNDVFAEDELKQKEWEKQQIVDYEKSIAATVPVDTSRRSAPSNPPWNSPSNLPWNSPSNSPSDSPPNSPLNFFSTNSPNPSPEYELPDNSAPTSTNNTSAPTSTRNNSPHVQNVQMEQLLNRYNPAPPQPPQEDKKEFPPRASRSPDPGPDAYPANGSRIALFRQSDPAQDFEGGAVQRRIFCGVNPANKPPNSIWGTRLQCFRKGYAAGSGRIKT